MFDFSWSELALIGVVALVVIGPKDLPKALRTAGVWVRKARTISREFQSSVEQMMREAELDEVKKQIESVSTVDIGKEIEKVVDPGGDLAESLKPPEMPDLNKIVNEPSTPPAPGPVVPPASPPDSGETPAPTAPVSANPETATADPAKPDPAKSDLPKPDQPTPAGVP